MAHPRFEICVADLTPEQRAAARLASSSSAAFFNVKPSRSDNLIVDCHIIENERMYPHVKFDFAAGREIKGDAHLDMHLLLSIRAVITAYQKKGLLPVKSLEVLSTHKAYNGKRISINPENRVSRDPEAKAFWYVSIEKNQFELHFKNAISHRFTRDLREAFAEFKAANSTASSAEEKEYPVLSAKL